MQMLRCNVKSLKNNWGVARAIAATLITLPHTESPFISELVKDHRVEVRNADGAVSSGEVRPESGCEGGFLVRRTGRYGVF